MLVCLDVDYRADGAVAACVGFAEWASDTPAFEKTYRSTTPPAEYEPGHFYRRELPYLLAVLGELETPPALVVVDGFVWLGHGAPGLGAHLYDALGGRCPVVGVAKRPFHEATAVSVVRGASAQPLFVSAVGIELDVAAAAVAAMHGPYRIPTLLKRVDRLSRT